MCIRDETFLNFKIDEIKKIVSFLFFVGHYNDMMTTHIILKDYLGKCVVDLVKIIQNKIEENTIVKVMSMYHIQNMRVQLEHLDLHITIKYFDFKNNSIFVMLNQ